MEQRGRGWLGKYGAERSHPLDTIQRLASPVAADAYLIPRGQSFVKALISGSIRTDSILGVVFCCIGVFHYHLQLHL